MTKAKLAQNFFAPAQQIMQQLNRMKRPSAIGELDGPSRPSATMKLMDWIPSVTPTNSRPIHLKPYVDALQEIGDGAKDKVFVVSAPPRHAKSETTLHFCVWYMMRFPTHRIAYVCFADSLTNSMQRKCLDIATRAGLQFAKRNESYWTLANGAEILWRSVKGGLTGEGANLIIIDDPYCDRATANSKSMRQAVADWYYSTAATRKEPGGNLICVATRWHPDDLSATILKEPMAQKINLPAISPDNQALWAERFPLSKLQEIKARNEYDFASLYMGEPRTKGGVLFRDCYYYDQLPTGVRYHIGFDSAYSKSTFADFSVAIVLAEKDGIAYVVSMYRAQVEATIFADILKTLADHYHATPRSYISGAERGIADFYLEKGVRIKAETAREDKFTRAQPLASAWNLGRVMLPQEKPGESKYPWLDDLIQEVTTATMMNDPHDDIVDALSAAFDGIKRASNGWTMIQTRMMAF